MLLHYIEKAKEKSDEEILDLFLSWLSEKKIDLYPAQEEAILEVFDHKNVILNTPTGSGKSLVALALHFFSVAKAKRSVYTCPIKALVNEKWLALCKEFGPEMVGLSTGDATVNKDAPILCCTAEVLANMALAEGESLAVSDVVMDEFHYYGDKDRGVSWQVPLLILTKARFLLMSATMGNTAFFEKELSARTGLKSVTVFETKRPVPLEFSYSEQEISNTVQKLIHEAKAPVYVVHFSQADAAVNAQNFMSLDLCNKEEKQQIKEAMASTKFSSPYGPDVKRWLSQGIGLHHAGLLPKYRVLVEKLAQKSLLKIICGTDTLGVGVNVPIRSVVLTQLFKYSGDKTAILTARDFHQIVGRAGRKGFDDVGYVYAQAPAHVIENIKLAAKSAQSGKRFVKKKAPERGFVLWDKNTFDRLIDSPPEPLLSNFSVHHGMLLNVLSRKEDGCKAMRDLIASSHESEKSKKLLKKKAFQLFRALVEAEVIVFNKEDAESSSKLLLNLNLQDHFAMNQPLSLYLLEAIALLDIQSPDYALDVISIVEAILENPELILRRQLEKERTKRLAELKAEGVEYEKRMEELEKVEYPKPLRDFLYDSFNEFAQKHPWIGQENVKPKSITREYLETFSTFSSYVKNHSLQRSEALLLRHLNSTYKVLLQTVPDSYKNEELLEIEAYLLDTIKRVDSSLLEEWERLKNPNFVSENEEAKAFLREVEKDILEDKKQFEALVRQRIFAWMTLVQREQFSDALDVLSEDLEEGLLLVDEKSVPWTETRLLELMANYVSTHGRFLLDAEARSVKHTHFLYEDEWVLVEQMLQDYNDLNDWSILFAVPLAASRELNTPLLYLRRIGESF